MLRVENLYWKTEKFSLKVSYLEVAKGEYFILLGPTGSGKTTLARCICGLNKIRSGKILLHNRDISFLKPEERKIGYLPQDFALFPNMNVKENILFGVKVRGVKFKSREDEFNKIVEILGIEKILNRNVNNLSGGEKQRVALARAVITKPELLILDEPFSSIDEGLRKNLWFEMKEVLEEFNIPIIHITHNLDEASILGTKIAILINGKIMQVGEKDKVFLKPASEEIARFIGIRNIYSGEVIDVFENKITIKSGKLKIIAFNEKNFKKGDKVRFSIIEQDIKILKEGMPVREELRENVFEGEIISSYFLSDASILKVKSSLNFELKFPKFIYERYNLYNGKKIKLGIWQKGITVFKETKL